MSPNDAERRQSLGQLHAWALQFLQAGKQRDSQPGNRALPSANRIPVPVKTKKNSFKNKVTFFLCVESKFKIELSERSYSVEFDGKLESNSLKSKNPVP